MKKSLTFAACSLLVACSSVQGSTESLVTNYETKGNLQVTQAVGCVGLDKLTNQHTPADIFPGVSKCIESKQFDKAADLFALAGVYGDYDKQRVSDSTAHQAVTVIRMNSFQGLDNELITQAGKVIVKHVKKGSTELNQLCRKITTLGHPNYEPTYMIQHGMSAFTGAKNSTVSDFDSAKAWAESLHDYLHCPANI